MGMARLSAVVFWRLILAVWKPERGAFEDGVRQQVELAIEEAQAVLFLVDSRQGIVAQDIDIGEQLRHSGSKVFVLVNKSEGIESALAVAEFQELGLGAPIAISAQRGDGVAAMLELVMADYSNDEESNRFTELGVPTFTLAGRPNVGKSTLANKLVGESRMLVSDTPGTTRDSVRLPLCINGQKMLLIDTAGVRRKSRVNETVEKFSVIKALQAIEQANVIILMLDASSEISFQDATIAHMIRDLGRSMVVVVNKWDQLENYQRKKIKEELERRLPFLPNPEIMFISALHGSNLAKVVPAALRAYKSAMTSIATSNLNRVLARAVAQTPPPMQNRRTVRLKFAHQAGKNPPVVVVHGNRAEKLPATYQRYLANYFARAYKLVGTPVRIIFRSAENPYINEKTPRSKRKKR